VGCGVGSDRIVQVWVAAVEVRVSVKIKNYTSSATHVALLVQKYRKHQGYSPYHHHAPAPAGAVPVMASLVRPRCNSTPALAGAERALNHTLKTHTTERLEGI
jgi:hypothetical protein